MRFRLNLQWLLLTVFFTILLSGSMLLKKTKIVVKTTTPTIEQRMSLAPWKKVTKSLSELGEMDEINKYFLFLNQVPKCGSEILILLLQKLQGFNNFRHIRLKGENKRYMTHLEQEYLVDDIYDTIKMEAVPLSFDQHVYFINFTQFDKQFPTYINFIRNPVEKVIRMYYKNKEIKYDYYYKCLISKRNNCNFKNGQPYDLSIPYFCGHNPRCMVLNSAWALQSAKDNVAKYFPVVGVLEELNTTLEILENKIPYFFKGAQKVYQKDLLNIPKKYRKPEIPKTLRRKLEESLADEIDFYNWIKSRLFKQLKIIYGEHNVY